jgi:hypothetical protein
MPGFHAIGISYLTYWQYALRGRCSSFAKMKGPHCRNPNDEAFTVKKDEPSPAKKKKMNLL